MKPFPCSIAVAAFASALAACSGSLSTPAAGTATTEGGTTSGTQPDAASATDAAFAPEMVAMTDSASAGDATPGEVTSGTPAPSPGVWGNRAPSKQHWTAVASDASGDHLVVTSTIVVPPQNIESGFWTSANGGATCAYSQAPAGVSSVASNASGTSLVAADGRSTSGGEIWTSTNAGATWNGSMSTLDSWASVASSADGTRLVAASGVISATGDVWTSSDSGVTWANLTAGTAASGQTWEDVASDSTGTKLVAITQDGGIWTIAM